MSVRCNFSHAFCTGVLTKTSCALWVSRCNLVGGVITTMHLLATNYYYSYHYYLLRKKASKQVSCLLMHNKKQLMTAGCWCGSYYLLVPCLLLLAGLTER
jgi:hypothetical protein